MNLSNRKLRILQAIIHSYITNAEPIGSRTISKKYDLGISSATIRNEMSDLEDNGYLNQPYTSAGRVPSDKAYRLYVNNLLRNDNTLEGRNKIIQKFLFEEIDKIEVILQNSAKILSKLTNYTSLAIAPQIKQSKLKHIQIVPVDDNKVLVVIVTESGIVKDTLLRIENQFSYDQLSRITNFLNKRLKGKIIGQIDKTLQDALIREMYNFKKTINSIVSLANDSFNEPEINALYSEGVTNIFNFPEYNDISKAKSFISFIENKNTVTDMLLDSEFDGIEIKIGQENSYDEIKDCSVITATYSLNGETIGKIGVIGPTRMEYSRVIKVVNSLALGLSNIMNKNKFHE